MKRPIRYMTPDIAPLAMPRCQGESYEALAPDTFDLAERADLTIRTLTNLADPDADYEIWWLATLNRKPPVMFHDFHDLNNQQGKFMEALYLLRAITGSRVNLDVDQAWAEGLLRMQGPDGLVYMPIEGRPWAHYHSDWLGERGVTQSKQLASIVPQGEWMGVMGLLYALSGDPIWKHSAQRLIDRMAQLVTHRDGYGYYAMSAVDPGAAAADQGLVDPSCQSEVGFTEGWIVNGLCQAYLATGYEPALSLARPLAVYLKDHSGYFSRQGDFLGAPHTHLHSRPLSGLLEYALLARDPEMMEFCQRSYDRMKEWSGSAVLGFFPSTPGPDMPPNLATIQRHCRATVEGCTIADVVALAIKLSQAGLGDYWDDAECYLRNQFAEMQIIRTDWVARTPPAEPTDSIPNPDCETTDRVVERNVGACMSLASPNDFVGYPVAMNDRPPFDNLFLMHCCTGNYARAIWYAWDNILTFAGGALKLNLLLNRASPWADVASHIPYQGRVDVHIKQACRLDVHIPQWARPEDTQVSVDGQARGGCSWSNRYIQVGAVKPGETVTLQWPIAERTLKEKLWATDYTLIVKGNTVVLIDPPGRYYPFYRRDHYREDQTRWVKRARFVASSPVPHWRY